MKLFSNLIIGDAPSANWARAARLAKINDHGQAPVGTASAIGPLKCRLVEASA